MNETGSTANPGDFPLGYGSARGISTQALLRIAEQIDAEIEWRCPRWRSDRRHHTTGSSVSMPCAFCGEPLQRFLLVPYREAQ